MNASTIAKDSFASGKLAADNAELKKTDQPDPVLQHLENLHLPLTRENYLETALMHSKSTGQKSALQLAQSLRLDPKLVL